MRVNKKILVIDDELTNLESIEMALRKENYKIYSTTDPFEGIELFEREKPTLIILDLRMPEMDGIDFLRKIQHYPDRSFSVIILSGHAHHRDIDDCYNLGANAFLRKPLDIIELRGLVRNLFLLEAHKEALEQHRNNLEAIIEQRTYELTEEIYERRQAEKALTFSEEKYRTLFENSAIGIGLTDDKGLMLEVNKSLVIIMKTTIDKLTNSYPATFFNDKERFEYISNTIRRDGYIDNIEVSLTNFDGEVVNIIGSCKRIIIGNNYSYLFTAVDITEIKKSRKALKESEHKFRSIFDEFRIPIILVSPEYIITDINKNFLNTLEYSQDKQNIINMEIGSVFDKESAVLFKNITQNLTKDSPQNKGNKFFLITKRKLKIEIKLRITVIFDDCSEISYFMIQAMR